MSVSVQEVLNDARKLATRLKKYDASTDGLLAKAQTLEKTVESMKEVSVWQVILVDYHYSFMLY